MAYPGEREHKEYLDYLIRVDTGEEPGPRLSKEEWRKRRKKQQQQQQQQQQRSVLDMDEEEFDRLPEKAKKALRGDVL